MGMFDYVNYSDTCTKCGHALTDFQSKDGECTLATVNPSEVRRFYTSCGKCHEWHEYKVVPSAYIIVRVTRSDA